MNRSDWAWTIGFGCCPRDLHSLVFDKTGWLTGQGNTESMIKKHRFIKDQKWHGERDARAHCD
jgi:hypothetical protein